MRRDWWKLWDRALATVMDGFNQEAKHIVVYVRPAEWLNDLTTLLRGDIKYAIISQGLIAVYCMIFLGTCSPIHCKFVVALVGVFCILISCIAGFGVCFIYDWKYSEISNVLPVLMIGIGVDDMFVICNAID